MCLLVSSVSPWCRRDRDKDIQDTSEHRCARSCPVRPRGVEERETRTRASTNVLARVLCVRAVSKRERQGHERALMCSLVSCASAQCRRERDKDTSEHISARSCPRCPHGAEGTGIRTYRTRASTDVLARVLCVRAVSKRERQGHERALMCSLVSCASARCRRERNKGTSEH